MNKYVITRGTDFFLTGTHCSYILSFAFIPFLGYEIYINKDIRLLYIGIIVFVGIFLVIATLSIFISLISFLRPKEYILYGNGELIYKEIKIKVKNIKSIDYYFGDIGGKGKKSTPYSINILYEKDYIDKEIDVLHVYKFPLYLLKKIRKENSHIIYSVDRIKTELITYPIISFGIGVIITIFEIIFR